MEMVVKRPCSFSGPRRRRPQDLMIIRPAISWPGVPASLSGYSTRSTLVMDGIIGFGISVSSPEFHISFVS